MPEVPHQVLEDIAVRTCFATKLARARQLVEARTRDDGPSPPVPPPTIPYPLTGNSNLMLDGSIREEAAEALFEPDSDMISLASMVLEAILAVRIRFKCKEVTIKAIFVDLVTNRLQSAVGREPSHHRRRQHATRIQGSISC